MMSRVCWSSFAPTKQRLRKRLAKNKTFFSSYVEKMKRNLFLCIFSRENDLIAPYFSPSSWPMDGSYARCTHVDICIHMYMIHTTKKKPKMTMITVKISHSCGVVFACHEVVYQWTSSLFLFFGALLTKESQKGGQNDHILWHPRAWFDHLDTWSMRAHNILVVHCTLFIRKKGNCKNSWLDLAPKKFVLRDRDIRMSKNVFV